MSARPYSVGDLTSAVEEGKQPASIRHWVVAAAKRSGRYRPILRHSASLSMAPRENVHSLTSSAAAGLQFRFRASRPRQRVRRANRLQGERSTKRACAAQHRRQPSAPVRPTSDRL